MKLEKYIELKIFLLPVDKSQTISKLQLSLKLPEHFVTIGALKILQLVALMTTHNN